MGVFKCDLSIVVPVYNVEEYLAECLDSIVEQDFSFSYEVILVNDGSTDGSRRICEEYLAKWGGAFRIIDQENQGLSAARNTGISNANGRYVLLLDSDDCLFEGGVQNILSLALSSQADIVVGNFVHFGDGFSERPNRALIETDGMKGDDYLWLALSSKKYIPAVWFKLYSNDFLKRNSIRFVPALINEDQLFTIQVFLRAKLVLAADVCIYRYRHREGSITRQLSSTAISKKIDSNLYSTKQAIQEVSNLDNKQLKSFVAIRFAKLLKSSLPQDDALTIDESKKTELKNKLIHEANGLQLHKYITPSRFSMFKAWLLLKLGFGTYIKLG